jgi:uncharacterized repeat protein (TIGR01451 family)
MRRMVSWTHAAVVFLGLAFPARALAQVFETEPNNSLIQADARPQFSGSVVISGDLPVGDVDLFRLNLSGTTVLRLESFDYGGMDCAGIATTVRLRNAANVVLYADSGGGIEGCGALVVAAPAGTYYMSIEEDGLDDAVGGYKLQIQVQAPAGLESEPNNDWTTADALPGSDVFIRGGIPAPGDADYFAITVPNGASIRAEVIEGDTATLCGNDTLDSYLVLYDGSGSWITDDHNSGRGTCSLIDGTGIAAPANGAAHNLPGGTYYLAVTDGGGSTFNYRLAVTVVTLPADLTISIQDAPDPVMAGTPVTYTVDVFNYGPGTANNVEVSDPLPPGMTFVEGHDDFGYWTCGLAAGVVTCRTPSVGPGAGAPPLYVTLTAPPMAGLFTNEVAVTSDEEGPDSSGDNSALTQSTATPPLADVAVFKTGPEDAVRLYTQVTYFIFVLNYGPSLAAGVVVRDTLPPEFQSATWSCTPFGGATCTRFGTGNIDQTVTLPVDGWLRYGVSGFFPRGVANPVHNVATVQVASNYSDPDPTNNMSETDTPISDVVFAEGFEAGPPEARLVINEFNANIERDCDLVELRVVSGGRMGDVELFERYDLQAVHFGNLGEWYVRKNDIILVHLNGASADCNPGASESEISGPEEFPAASYPGNSDKAYDWYSGQVGLQSTDTVLTVTGLTRDTVLAASAPSGPVHSSSEAMAAEMAALGQWHMVGGGIPPGGFVDDNFCAHAVLDLDATGNTVDGMSIQRTTNTDSNDKNGWTMDVAPSWGQLNVGQTP